MVKVTSINITPGNIFLRVGEWYYNACAEVIPTNATCKSVTWRSSNSNIASVNETDGYICANAVGTATIYADAIDGSGVSGSCTVTVDPPILVETISLSSPKLRIGVGETVLISASVTPVNATNKKLTWSTNKPSVLSVNSAGRVTAKAVGSATVYATASDGSGVQAFQLFLVRQSVTSSVEETSQNTSKNITASGPVEMYNGCYSMKNTLMNLFGGQNLSLVAHYNSTKLTAGTLGIGWYHNFEKHLLDSGCDEILIYENPSIYSKYNVNNECYTEFICNAGDKRGYILTVNSSSATHPYCLNCNYDRFEYYNTDGKLVKIVNRQGFETTISHTDSLITITDTVTGQKMYLEKNSAGKIVKVYDDNDRKATLTYSDNLLTKITDVNGNSISYTYNDDNQIESGTDSKGICYFTNTYDDYGRILTQKDAIEGSTATVFAYNDDGTRTTTNRNGDGNTRTYDENGLMTKYTDENGNSTTYTYDDYYNIIEETDALSNSLKKTYNTVNRPTTITDKNGKATTITYDVKGNITKIKYPANSAGVVPQESFTYNSRNQMLSHTDLRGTVTQYTYDTNGMPLTKKVGSKNAIQYAYENGLLKSVTDAIGNKIQYEYNELGQMIKKTDAQNHIITYEYDKSGHLLKTTDANNKSVTNTYDGNYQKTSVTDANGNKTEYAYNGNLKNTSVSLPDGNKVSYEYDGEDRLVKTTDQAGNKTVTQYDKGGRVTSQQAPDGATVKYTYDKAGRVIKETNPKNAATTKTYDAAGNILTVTDADGNQTKYEYDSMSRPVKKTNAKSGVTTYTYSDAGDLLSETDPLGKQKTYTYDAYGNRLTAKDARGNTTTYTYDANNNLLTVKDALNNTTTYTYNSLNQLVSVKDARGNTVTYGYDALGRRTTVTDAKNNTFTTEYDANGNVVKTTDAKGNTVSQTVYNSLNLPTTVTDAVGKSTTYTYNALGKVASVTDSMNNTQEYLYNSRGLNTQVTDAKDNISTATYDLLGNVTKLQGPLGGKTEYTYDSMGRLTDETTVSGGVVSYTYNELNLKETLTNARKQQRTFTYDAKGRITSYTAPEGTVSYTYDENGNVLTVTDSHGKITRTFDKLNRVASYTDTYNKTIRYTYDAVGNLTKITYPDNTAVNYEYDVNNNLTKVTDWANRITTYTYDANNRVVGVTKPDGSVTTTVYDNKQRVTSTVEKTSGGTVITGFEYTYDDLSRIVEEKVLANSTKMCYTYDELSRVTKRTIKNLSGTVLSEESFTYDAAGNVTGGSASTTFVYDNNNRLTTYNGKTVTYDADGNMLSNGTMTCTYDSGNRLLTAGGNTYTYNAENVRIRNLCDEYDTTYTYDTNGRLSRLLQKITNSNLTKYVYGRGLIGEEKHGVYKTYHFDCRGSTVAITDLNGNITDTFAYDTYGKLTARTGDTFVIFGYNGRDGVVTDKNGLIYMRARYYSPAMRRFVNADIIPGKISNAVTLNRFAYANGNPVSMIDPFGLSAISNPHMMLYDTGIGGGGGSSTSSGGIAERQNSICYQGFSYDIFVPTYTESDDLNGWNIVDTQYYDFGDNVSFNWNQFIVDLIEGPDDMDGLATGEKTNISPQWAGRAALYSLVYNFFRSASKNHQHDESSFIFSFQEKDGQRRVIIKYASSGTADILSEYAGKKVRMTSAAKDGGKLAWISTMIGDLYNKITGEKTYYFTVYDLLISVDKAHKNSDEVFYFWLNNNGDLMVSPILYENDKVQLGKGYFVFTPLYTFPINNATQASDDYKNMFIEAIESKGMHLH